MVVGQVVVGTSSRPIRPISKQSPRPWSFDWPSRQPVLCPAPRFRYRHGRCRNRLRRRAGDRRHRRGGREICLADGLGQEGLTRYPGSAFEGDLEEIQLIGRQIGGWRARRCALRGRASTAVDRSDGLRIDPDSCGGRLGQGWRRRRKLVLEPVGDECQIARRIAWPRFSSSIAERLAPPHRRPGCCPERILVDAQDVASQGRS